MKDWRAEWIDDFHIRIIPPEHISKPWRVSWAEPGDGFDYIAWEMANALAGERKESID